MSNKRNYHFPIYWFVLLIMIFVILSIMPFLAGSIVSFISSAGDGKFKYLKFGPLFPSLMFFMSSFSISIIIALILWIKVLLPLNNISQAAKLVSKGDFSVRVNSCETFRELKELTDNFNRMVQELGSIESFKNDFVTTISHEFKTPLAAIEGYVTLLQNPALTKEDQEEYTRIILDSTRQLSSMAGNILLMSRLEKQEIVTNKTHLQLDEQIRQAILLLEPLWEKKHLDLDISLFADTYYGNAELLLQIWINLLQNAIKFTPAGGTLSVFMATSPREISVSIADTGIGMDDATLQKIFDKFYSKEADSTEKGNGLGLSITKRIVDLLHGHIAVTSIVDEGSLFIVTLPVEKEI